MYASLVSGPAQPARGQCRDDRSGLLQILASLPPQVAGHMREIVSTECHDKHCHPIMLRQTSRNGLFGILAPGNEFSYSETPREADDSVRWELGIWVVVMGLVDVGVDADQRSGPSW